MTTFSPESNPFDAIVIASVNESAIVKIAHDCDWYDDWGSDDLPRHDEAIPPCTELNPDDGQLSVRRYHERFSIGLREREARAASDDHSAIQKLAQYEVIAANQSHAVSRSETGADSMSSRADFKIVPSIQETRACADADAYAFDAEPVATAASSAAVPAPLATALVSALPVSIQPAPTIHGVAKVATVVAATRSVPIASPTIATSPATSPPVPFPNFNLLGHFPAFMTRSSLFRCGQARTSDDRKQKSKIPVVATHLQVQSFPTIELDIQGDFSLAYTGPRLGMSDKLVYEAVIDIAKAAKHDINTPLRTSLRAISLAMGWEDLGGGTLRWISTALIRLSCAQVEIDSGTSLRCCGRLLEQVNVDTTGVQIRFDPAFTLKAFSNDQQFLIDRKRSAGLSGTLAQWLHDFLSTHEEGHPLTVGYLLQISGFEAASGKFPGQLRTAMDELVDKAPTLVAAYSIDRRGKKSSDKWEMTVKRGEDKPKFKRPPGASSGANTGIKGNASQIPKAGSAQTHGASKRWSAQGKPPNRRAGVVL